MVIEPDDKDWTWVLSTPCPECGFDAAAVDRNLIGDAIRANADLWPALLDRDDVAVRPSDGRWSALEYACHVRDVFVLFDERLRRMLTEDGPEFENWDQDVTAVEKRYNLQDPVLVADNLFVAGESVAATWDRVADDQWDRRGFRSDGSVFTVDSFARYFMHDPVHHLVDVVTGNAELRA